MLKELGFALYYIQEHPHQYILYFVKILGGDSALAQLAWAYCNDVMRLDLCVRHPAAVLACACIMKAGRAPHPAHALMAPEQARDGPALLLPWYTVMCNLDSDAPLLEIGRAIDNLYSLEKVCAGCAFMVVFVCLADTYVVCVGALYVRDVCRWAGWTRCSRRSFCCCRVGLPCFYRSRGLHWRPLPAAMPV